MKKNYFLLACIFITTSIFAQEELSSKKGEPFLPEKGDWCISIDASPFLKYAGNFIGSNGLNASPTFDFLSGNQTILLKYFVDPSKAYRVGLRLGLGSISSTSKVSTIPFESPTTYVDNVSKVSNSNIGLTAGMEWRKGKTRLQGFYGAEAGLAFGSSIRTYTYGNELKVSNPVSRIIENKSGATFGLGLRGFIGAEYFIIPKISIGGEFGWGLGLSTTGEGENTTEYWNSSAVKTTVTPTGGSTSIGIDTDHLNTIFGPAGTIRLSLHF
jgi:hypothetical protein